MPVNNTVYEGICKKILEACLKKRSLCGNIPSPFAKGNQSFSVNIAGQSPTDKPTTDMQITGGELGDGIVTLPSTGFEDSVEYAVFELQNGESSIITVVN